MASVRHLGLFPWCVNPTTAYFSTEDLLQYAVPMWWRVKEWTLQSEFGIFYSNPEIPTNTITATNTFNITTIPISTTNPGAFTTEKDLVCAGVFYDQQSGVSFPTTYDWVFSFVIGDPTTLGQGLNECVLTLGPKFLFEVPSVDDTRTVTMVGGGATLGSLNVEFCGLSFSVPLRQPYTEPSLAMVSSCACTLSATAYWPYDPSDGKGPIYDSVTGEQLRGFPG